MRCAPYQETWPRFGLLIARLGQITIPPGVPNGAYILRHEIISLQNAVSGGAESYPSCFQLQVAGSESTLSPTTFVASLPPNSTIQLPGGYNKNDPGWKVDVYTNPEKLDYSKMFPGPSIPGAITKAGGGNNSVVTTTTTSSLPPNGTNTPVMSSSSSPIPTSSPLVITTTITQTLVLTVTIDPSDSPLNTTSTSGVSTQPTPTATTQQRRNIPSRIVRSHPSLAEKRRTRRGVSPPRHH